MANLICNATNGDVWLTVWFISDRNSYHVKLDDRSSFSLVLPHKRQTFLHSPCPVSLFRKTQLAHQSLIVDNNLVTISVWKGIKHLNIDSTDSNMQVTRTNCSVSSDFILHSVIGFGICLKWIVLYLLQFVTSGNLSNIRT